TLTFRSIVGDITGIVITCGYKYYADDLSADWRYDSENGTLIWVGTPAETVTLSGHVDVVNISSIEFFYDPAPAPRKGETFFGIYKQYYQITGAHTAKLPAQDLNHTLDIPEYVDYEDVRYYVTEIADYAFYGQAELPNVMRGVNIAKIGAHAFDGCIQITDISLYSDVLDTIGDAAFKDCKLMSNFDCFTELPPVLGSNAFSGTTYLNRIRVNSSYTVDAYKAATNWSEYADKIVTLWENPAIGEEFFWHNQMTTNWYAVSSVSPIKEAKVLPYPVGVKAIYPRTLVGRLVIPEEISYLYLEYKVTGIGENAYKDSTRFYMVMIPQSVKSIESGAFLNCTGVENVQFLWDDPRGTVTWADANVGAEFKTAASGETRICVPKGTLAYYQEWAPAWAECMVEGEIFDIDVTASEDPEHIGRYYRTFYDSETDYLMPPSVWAHAGYVSGGNFVLSPVAFDGMVLPRGTAVVLESETPTYRLVPVGNTAPLYDGPNELVGTDVDIQRTSVGDNGENVYVLGKQASVGGNLQVGMGLYRYTGTTLGAHKAYLIYDAPAGPNSAPARFVFKHEQTTTDVENVQSDKVQCTKVIRDGQLIIIKDGKEYNAQGQILK
ncbi:MAG: leucine-rich repeat protein, partial [Paludibacteraceae bacterium]|nr:leucine-rich repeat protein [Paludibacteraceae bacterium]